VTIPASKVELAGDLTVPEGAQGVVLFAHGSGSSRHSPRNQFVARQLAEAGLATLLFICSPRRRRSGIGGPGRCGSTCSCSLDGLPWRAVRERVAPHAIAEDRIFRREHRSGRSADRGGALPRWSGQWCLAAARPDLASDALEYVQAATLLIVDGEDREVIELNRQAYARLFCEKAPRDHPGATHLFEEPGALEAVDRLATAWFRHHLRRPRRPIPKPNQGDMR